MAGQRL
ncbi:2-succinyl-5-enolpyruvyl-6-hydroxy-3-cyclohexene-1-carboxylate synthase domain protein, partial [Yersinia pestis PY-01]